MLLQTGCGKLPDEATFCQAVRIPKTAFQQPEDRLERTSKVHGAGPDLFLENWKLLSRYGQR